MGNVKLIAMDLDGTLITREGVASEANIRALQAASESGVVIATCSGRYPENASLVFLDHGLTGPIVGVNGAHAIDRPMGDVLFMHPMDMEAAKKAHERLTAFHVDYIIFAPKLVATSRSDMRHHSELNDGARITSLGHVRYLHGEKGVEEALESGILKYYIFDNGHLPEIKRALSDIEQLDITRSNAFNIELMPKGINKGTGITELARWLQIPLSDVMVLGDEENDLPMLTLAGYGVAMGNAPDHVKQQARYVTAPFEEDGIARAIERFVLD
ncbi:MAG: HAD family phosphatase [Clostridia bacterium]|nr:HAD family phosphatase [Clostridia bacterium]